VFVGCSAGETPKVDSPSASEPASDITPPAAPDTSKLLYGTWVLNLSKSKYDPPELTPKSNKAVFEEVPGGVHVLTDGVDAQGRATHADYTATFDGPDIPTNGIVGGKPNKEVDSAAWKKIDDRTYEVINKRKGEVVNTNRIVISADGKSRTSTVTGKTDKGKPVNNTFVMERQ
jgi:hypothetical protein